ncbi:uncharacterized protein CDAR_371981 [Caerostris darwini]|uniref:Uncharacterized protein n=1 Tax=Caerostris darwini TaxID=1538125 RepID=A0AAV4VYQ0_9ARAC|nr:uncharacterized protein CDAR_371981 [Caerostris darwini]
MGVGGSTSRPNSATVIMSNKRPQTSSSENSAIRDSAGHHSSPPDHRPTNSCCSHYKENHAGVTRTATPADPPQSKADSIDDEIEEIVANTLDLVSNQRTSRQTTPHLRDTDRGGGRGVRQDVTSSATSSGMGQRRILRSESTRLLQKRADSDQDSDVQFDAKVLGESNLAGFLNGLDHD